MMNDNAPLSEERNAAFQKFSALTHTFLSRVFALQTEKEIDEARDGLKKRNDTPWLANSSE